MDGKWVGTAKERSTGHAKGVVGERDDTAERLQKEGGSKGRDTGNKWGWDEGLSRRQGGKKGRGKSGLMKKRREKGRDVLGDNVPRLCGLLR
jgi:hypothetical protein